MAESIPRVDFFDAVADATGGNEKIQRSEYLASGRLPVIDQGQSDIAGFTDVAAAEYRGLLPVVLFGDHTRAFKYVDFPFALGADGVKVLEPKPGFDARFLFYYFRSVSLPNAGYSRHFKFLKEVSVPKPSANEQRRLVDLLTRAEGIVRLRREGQKKAAEIIPALFLDMFGDAATNPKGFDTAPLGNLVSFASGGTPSRDRPDYWEGTLPWVSPKDMKTTEVGDSIDRINHKALDETSLKLIPANAVLIVVRGMILAHSVPVAITTAPVTINQDMKALLPSPTLTGGYLAWALRIALPELLNSVTTAAHGTKKLETERLKSLRILVPSLERQCLFETRSDAVRSILAQQSAALAKAEATFNALLAQVFSSVNHPA